VLILSPKCDLYEQKSIDAPVVVIGKKDCKKSAEQLIGLGAFDYIKGADDHQRFGKIIDRVKGIKVPADSTRSNYFSNECPSSVSIVGKSDATAKTLTATKIRADIKK